MTPPIGSISSRLTRELLLAVGALWLVMSLGVTYYVQHEIDDVFDDSLMASASRLLELAAHEVGEARPVNATTSTSATSLPQLPLVKGSIDAAEITHLDLPSLTYQIVAPSGAVLMRSQRAPTVNIAPDVVDGFHTIGAWRVYSRQHPTEPLRIHVADSVSHRSDERRNTIVWLLLPLLAAFGFIAWVVRRITQRSLAPIEGLVTEIAARGVTNMDPVGSSDLPAEARLISESTNRLLLRLKEALDVERSLAANAAHELRTPLTAARLRLSTALSQPLPDAARAAMDEAAASLDRLSRRAEKLLQMSRAEASAALSRGRVDLGRLAREVANEFSRGDSDAPRLRVLAHSDAPIFAVGDVDALALVLRNLIENALRHAPSATVTIEVGAPALITVRDDGPGVDASMLATMSQRHVRRAVNLGGYGLGLSIVKTVVDRHDGTLQFFSPPPGQITGLAAVVSLTKAT
jgi:two-component system, OmpR family, sensor kinase